MGEGWQGLGSGHEELSPAACLLGGRIEAFSTALVDPITMDLHEHSCAVSRNFLSGKVCFSCPASVFACACQINNISCWVIGNKCKNFWVYDANPYGIISSRLYKDFSDHRIWHGYTAKPVGWQRELGVQPLQDPAWSQAEDGKILGLIPCPHSSPQAWRSSYGLLSCTKLAGGEGCAGEGYQSCVEMETQGVEIVWSSRAPQEGQHWSCCAARLTLTADIWTKVRCVPQNSSYGWEVLAAREGCFYSSWGDYSKSTKLPTKMWSGPSSKASWLRWKRFLSLPPAKETS